MTLGERRARVVFRLRHPRTTVRWRLTLLYGGLFLASGAALLGITYTLVEHATLMGPSFANGRFIQAVAPPGQVPPGVTLGRRNFVHSTPSPRVPAQIQKLLKSRRGRAVITFVGSGQRIADLHQLEVESVIALAIMAVMSGALGWLVAGRVLRPLRMMTATTQQISEANLHRRLAMRGPRDELRQLSDTIDGLLGRMEAAFDAQRRFVANASHELRTPLTVTRALLEMIISDPRATVATFRTTCRQVLDESDQQEQLIDALLALAHGQRGIEHPEPVDLAAVTDDVLRGHADDAAALGLQVVATLDGATLSGDRRLIERLISNLLENALRHNVAHGLVHVRVGVHAGRATVAISNTGPVVPADEVDRLLQPFQRLTVDRTGHRDGLGLGLSIVAAIADAHGATLDVRPGADGGLDIAVRFPRTARGGPRVTPVGSSRQLQPARGQLPPSPPNPRLPDLA